MDIDDILADVSVETIAQETRDLQELTRAWVGERAAPEILPYPEALLERTMERIRKQIERVEMQTGVMDPKTNFGVIILQTELERFKFLVRAYLRTRLEKIDRHALHILTTPALNARLAAGERQYAATHQQLLHHHYLASFLRDFPDQLRRLDDTAGGISMMEAPDLESAVFCRVLRDMTPPGVLRRHDEDEDEDDVGWKRGDVHVLRYSAIKELVLVGDVELI
ncbi:MAG: GINS complex subunit [Thelocarpon superellum]|nr:MAG: GINS complex subunit [Thelocarpon superellum]